MKKINFDNYFINSESKFYDAKMIVSILEVILGKPINIIKKDIDDAQIVVTEEQIRNYLAKKCILEKKIQQQYGKEGVNLAKYHFVPFTLEYFKKYTSIVRNKLTKLINIISKIGARDISSIQDELIDLGVILNEYGNISKDDIIRLIEPTVYNYHDLEEKVKQANNLDTYITFKKSKHSLMWHGISEEDIYPFQSLQIKNLYHSNIAGCVKLSENQQKELCEEKNKKNIMILTYLKKQKDT